MAINKKVCKECGKKHYAKNLCRTCYMRIRRTGKPILKKHTYCKSCGIKEHYAKGFCKKCYWQHWSMKSGRKKGTNRRGKMEYNPDLHSQQGKKWTAEDLEYLCKFIEVESIRDLSYAFERTEASVEMKLQDLRKTGKFDYYKQSYERKLNDG